VVELINTYDIPTDTLDLGTTDIAKTFGIVDMYKDDTNSADVYRIEKNFAALESHAARIINQVDSAIVNGEPSVQMSRQEVNVLRKFLFLMHYRNGGHAKQFLTEDFDEATRLMVDRYRQEHNLRDSWAVWLRNIAILLEDEHWETPSDERLLFTARKDYQMDAWAMQLGFYASNTIPFLLSNNSLGLSEGSATLLHEVLMPGGKGFFPMTRTYAVTPRLAIILRSSTMSLEQLALDNGVPPSVARQKRMGMVSYFDELPRIPAETTYISPVNWSFLRQETDRDRKSAEDFHRKGLLHGKPKDSRVRDRFHFYISDLTISEANRVNTLILTHVNETICFADSESLFYSVIAFERDHDLPMPPGFSKDRYTPLRVHFGDVNQEDRANSEALFDDLAETMLKSDKAIDKAIMRRLPWGLRLKITLLRWLPEAVMVNPIKFIVLSFFWVIDVLSFVFTVSWYIPQHPRPVYIPKMSNRQVKKIQRDYDNEIWRRG
jgi:hypothetical protein